MKNRELSFFIGFCCGIGAFVISFFTRHAPDAIATFGAFGAIAILGWGYYGVRFILKDEPTDLTDNVCGDRIEESKLSKS